MQGGGRDREIDLRDERTGYSIMEEKGVRNHTREGKGKREKGGKERERKKGNREVEEQEYEQVRAQGKGEGIREGERGRRGGSTREGRGK